MTTSKPTPEGRDTANAARKSNLLTLAEMEAAEDRALAKMFAARKAELTKDTPGTPGARGRAGQDPEG